MNRTVTWLAALAIAASGAGCVAEQSHNCSGFRTHAHREYATPWNTTRAAHAAAAAGAPNLSAEADPLGVVVVRFQLNASWSPDARGWNATLAAGWEVGSGPTENRTALRLERSFAHEGNTTLREATALRLLNLTRDRLAQAGLPLNETWNRPAHAGSTSVCAFRVNPFADLLRPALPPS